MDNPMGSIWAIWLVVGVASFAVLEAWSYWRYGGPGTFTYWMRYWSGLHPIVPYLLVCSMTSAIYHIWVNA